MEHNAGDQVAEVRRRADEILSSRTNAVAAAAEAAALLEVAEREAATARTAYAAAFKAALAAGWSDKELTGPLGLPALTSSKKRAPKRGKTSSAAV
ncbi:hypothetical protein ACUH9X_08040 [Dermabacteraceae bacterium P13147]